YTINDPKIYYYTLDPCTIPPPPAPSVNHFEKIQRIAVYGSLTRTLYSHQVNTNCPENPDVWSNLVSDNNFVYWMSGAQGVVKLSVDANVGDAPTLIDGLPDAPAEFRLEGGTLYVLTESGSSSLWAINPSNGHSSLLEFPGAGSQDFQA